MNSGLEISDLMTENVVYFSDEDEEDLARFCELRDIDYLPLKKGFKVMEYDDGFSEEKLTSDRILAPDERIFDQEVIEGFLDGVGVKFVTSGGEIKGVIHFSDYNSKKLYTELYRVLHGIEQDLRRILEGKKIKEEDLEKKWRNPGNQALPLSTSGLKDLIARAEKEEDLDIEFRKDQVEESKKQIVVLRNRVMHSKEMVLMQDSSKENLSFSNESFSYFVDRAREAYKLKDKLERRVEKLPEHPVLDNIRRT